MTIIRCCWFQSTSNTLLYYTLCKNQNQIARAPNTFDGQPLPLQPNDTTDLCLSTAALATTIDTSQTFEFQAAKDALLTIADSCGFNGDTISTIQYLLLYFEDVDFQHTTAYELQYFKELSTIYTVDQYFPKEIDDEDYEAITALYLLGKIENYLKTRTSKDCDCPPDLSGTTQ